MVEHSKQIISKTQDLLLSDFKKLLPIGHLLIGIDYGTVRIGLSLSDKDRQVALPFKTISKLKELDEIVQSKEPAGFVVGLPLQTNGEEGDIAKQVRLFINRLKEKYSLPVYLVDERYTSKRAQEQMEAVATRYKKIQKSLDSRAAVLILQKALNELNEK